MRYFIADSPFLGVFLKHQEDINQVFSCVLLKDFNKLRKVGDGTQFELIAVVLKDSVKSTEHIVFGVLGSDDLADFVET